MKKDLSILNGVLLGDGNLRLRGSSRLGKTELYVRLSGAEHIDWLQAIKKDTEELGVQYSSLYPKVYRGRYTNGKAYTGVLLVSRATLLLSEQYNRWYCKGKKSLPLGLVLNPLTLAHWYMGDGSSSYIGPNGQSVLVSLCTEGFSKKEVEVLIRNLRDIGITDAYLIQRTIGAKKYPRIYIGKSAAVRRFMNAVEPYLLPSYKYKIKIPKIV